MGVPTWAGYEYIYNWAKRPPMNDKVDGVLCEGICSSARVTNGLCPESKLYKFVILGNTDY